MTRYDGKPFLRITELYVLRAINSLTPNDEATLLRLEPMLQDTFKLNDMRWYDIVELVLDLPPSFNLLIQDKWNGYKTYFGENTAIPEEFARQFVDSNLSQ